MEETKEFKALKTAISLWVEKHKGNVIFTGSFLAFNEKDNIIEDMLIGHGYKESINTSIDCLQKQLKKEKKEFVNW